jgi:hypothetical protein
MVDVPAGTLVGVAPLPAEDAVLTAVLPPGDGIEARTLVQQRLAGGRGRVVERLTLRSGRQVVVKTRNDRALDREALLYRRLLPCAGELVPGYAGSAAVGGVHVLVLDYVDGRPGNPSAPGDRERAMAALARFHRAFSGASVAAILGPAAPPELAAEATPDPIEQPDLLRAYRDALTALAAVLPVSVYRQAEEHMEPVASAIAASPLLLDPGDVRPENVLLGADRTVLLDFENAAVRRSALALAAMLAPWSDPGDLLRRYLAHRGGPANIIVASVHAGQVWLAVREVAARVASGAGVSTERVQHLLQGSGG